ncbi:hypothetical protein FACS18942_07560 [Planctomycetales bacterium]|nr:hypothetical protein FACS18942_07560 [Planctomycetales bacterium]
MMSDIIYKKHRYNKFSFYKAPITELIQTMSKALGNSCHLRERRCAPFSSLFIDRIMYLNANFYSPEPSSAVFFSPKICPNNTIGIILKSYSWEYWLRRINPSLEILSLRYTTNDKDEDAIRELILYHHNEDFDRIIRVMKDQQWKLLVDSRRPQLSDPSQIVNCRNMHVAGQPQPFEEGKSFEKIRGKCIKDYFTMEDMIRFANNWGCPFDQDEFWQSDELMYCFGSLEGNEQLADWTEYPNGFERL